MNLLILPGYGGSGPEHWQTLWEKSDPAFRRVAQNDWEHPVREEWVAALQAAVAAAPGPVVLVAHSLACLLVGHWAASAPASALGKVQAALLVAVPDPSGPEFPRAAQGFSAPDGRLPFESLLVASANDPYGTPDFSRRCALTWGCGLVELGPLGHINAASGLGAWPEGRSLLETLL